MASPWLSWIDSDFVLIRHGFRVKNETACFQRGAISGNERFYMGLRPRFDFARFDFGAKAGI